MYIDRAQRRRRRLFTALLVLVVLAGLAGWFTWYKFFRDVPQPEWVNATGHSRFKYGSIGAEYDAGFPYWIIYVLPRMFPEKLPGPGGYASFGLAWEEGQELPIGFTKKTIGFDRVANNCAACHTASYRTKVDQNPRFVPTGPNHTFDLEAFFRFLVDCANDPRFNSDTMMAEINLASDLSFVDRAIYRYLLIPATKRQLKQREPQFAWIYKKPHFAKWGRGRDDAMNLTRYFLIRSPLDDYTGPTDMPSIWNLQKYRKGQGGTRMNFAGDSYNARSVIIDSALGLLGAAPNSNERFLGHVEWLENYLSSYKPPKYPAEFPIDRAKAAEGRKVFVRECARCHFRPRVGTVVPVEEVGTDRERLDSWSGDAARRSNEAVLAFGIKREGLVEEDLKGYIAAFLDGIWLRAPYLHNGSVPTLRDLLKPVAERPKVFYRGYDLYDPVNVGFVSCPDTRPCAPPQLDDVMRVGTRYDVNARACSNKGHEYGVKMLETDKDALIEYLKTQ